jgi:catechol 2,3-dioxygenase-like lactoylglutathione lyase family enzyme
MLGRFLEISLHTPDIQESLNFYESLGFVQATVGETWTHPYAVVTDGRLYLGLHGRPCPPLAVTYVQPDLANHAPRLHALGIEFNSEHYDIASFNQSSFADPSGLRVNLLEARTFSPIAMETHQESTCGYFSELGVPVRDYKMAHEFWESLGFVGMEPEHEPLSRLVLTGNHFNLALYKSRALRQPVLTFEDENMRERLARLRERNFRLSDEMPDSLDAATNAVLIAPEGTRLLLLSPQSG